MVIPHQIEPFSFSSSLSLPLTRQELLDMSKSLFGSCEACLQSKPNTAPDRGILSALPISQVANDTLYIDFIDMTPHKNFTYVLTVVDSLTPVTLFIPCSRKITGKGTLKIILSEWIYHFDKPTEILSDNDVRFSQEKGFYQSAFKAMGVSIHFSLPRRTQSNRLCKRVNDIFLRNLRAMSHEFKTVD